MYTLTHTYSINVDLYLTKRGRYRNQYQVPRYKKLNYSKKQEQVGMVKRVPTVSAGYTSSTDFDM